jgi:glycosyltransferase involved in cell wall biosynthesis
MLVAQSLENLKVARDLFPGVRTALIPFGIGFDSMATPPQRPVHRPVRVVSLGSDMHRDWRTLVAAIERWPGCTLRIASAKIDRRLIAGAANAEIVAATSRADVIDLYSSADIAVVPLKPNLHISGITVILEATIQGLPVICTDTGGLRGYFSEEEVRYIPPNDSDALRRAIEDLAADDQLRFTMARRAQARMLSDDYSSRACALRHYELSRQLMDEGVGSFPTPPSQSVA